MDNTFVRALKIHAAITVVAVVGFAIFDLALSLGQFAGLVAGLYSSYFLGLQAIYGIILAASSKFKKSLLPWGLAALTVSGVGILLVFAVSSLLA